MNAIRTIFFSLFMALLPFGAGAADDSDAAIANADRNLVPRFPGFHIDSATVRDFDEFLFATKGFEAAAEGKGEQKAGKFAEIRYVLDDGARAPSAAELIANYENAVKKINGKMLHKALRTSSTQGAVYRMAPAGGGERWIQLEYYNQGEAYMINVVDVADMVQKVEFTSSEMADRIRKDGFVSLHGILFDTAKASLKPESEKLLAEILAMLQSEKTLRIAVEGHTDNVGDKKSNMELSQQRADTVVKWLVAKGIDAKRLKAGGKGDSMPVADNRSEEGRAKNRRVELVKF